MAIRMRSTSVLMLFVTFVLGACGGSSGGGGAGNNTAPEANDGVLSIERNTTGNDTLGASDADGDALTYSVVANGTLGTATVTDAVTGAYSYTPNADAFGTDTFTFSVNDGTTDSNTATVTVTINPAFTMRAVGGIGGEDGGSGGAGDYLYVEKYGSGDLAILSSGVASTTEATSVAALTSSKAVVSINETAPDTFLGDVPLEVNADLVISVQGTEPAAGTYYLINNNFRIYLSDGDNTLGNVDADEEIVTGVRVASGVTLTLGLNSSTNTEARIDLLNDFHNLGTVTTPDFSATQRGNLEINPASFVNEATIALAGTLDGQNGGDINVDADFSFYNHGPINTSGANGTAGVGGDAGQMDLDAEIYLQNTADLTANGGDSTTAAGGDGNYIDLDSSYGDVVNTGNLSAMGGDGTAGGDGGYNRVYCAYACDSVNTGDLNTSGGTGSAGNGGDADYIQLQSYSGHIYNTGNLTARGGDTTDPAFNGGDGDYVDFDSSEDPFTANSAPVGNIEISGDIDTSGGDAVATGTGDGGDAGYVDATMDNEDLETGQHLKFMGYTSINVSGGDGNFGGNAATSDVEMNSYDADTEEDIYVPSGNIINEADIIGNGGNVVATATTTPANGGDGTNVSIEIEDDSNVEAMDRTLGRVTNTGNISINGGNDLMSTTNTGGVGGYVYFWGYNGIDNSGNISANGGNDLGTIVGGCTNANCYGSRADYVQMYSENGTISNSGNIIANGGNGVGEGGEGAYIELWGLIVTNSGDISTNGGDADPTLGGSTGGDADYISLYSPNGTASTSTGTASYSGGTGDTPGDDASILVGGMCQGDCDNNSTP